ncbi:DUF2569 family protein [Cohnella suwonensis]|uniref:DUF2569 family protein n=1 Tax=Cohnella suwonensis TaxID=696072 RepID=A0ABW0LX76_9BACL
MVDSANAHAIIGITGILTIVFLFAKKSYSPVFIVIIEAFRVGIWAYVFVSSDIEVTELSAFIVRAGVGLVWIFYFVRSNRVRETYA